MDETTFVTRFNNWQANLEEIRESYSTTDISKFHELCQLYLEANPKQRQQLPYMVAPDMVAPVNNSEGYYRLAFLIYEYMRQVSQRIGSPEDVQLLRLGLAAAAIVEERIDFRDIIVSLAFLHHAATRVGIDPSPHFKQVADMSRPETRKFLRGFLSRSRREIESLVRLFA